MVHSLTSPKRSRTASEYVSTPAFWSVSFFSYSAQFGISATRDFDGVSIHQSSTMEWASSFNEFSNLTTDHRALSWVKSWSSVPS